MGTLAKTTYSKLLKDVRIIIEQGKHEAVRVAGRELLRTYWNVGKRICKEGFSSNARDNASVLEDLSEDLVIDYSTLMRCIHFFQTYDFATSSEIINWSHYKYLLSMNDPDERNFYEGLIERENLSVLALSSAIKTTA